MEENNIKNMKDLDIYRQYEEEIKNIYIEFKNLNIKLEEYTKLIMEVINNTKGTYRGEGEYIDFLKEEILCSLFLQYGDSFGKTEYSEDNLKDYRTENVNLYRIEMSKIPQLTAEEEKLLAYQVRRGNEQAKRRLIEGNLRLVTKLARLYSDKGVPYMDLIQEGNLGLIKAVDGYDVTMGFRFSTYAYPCIFKNIINALKDSSLIRLPKDVSTAIYNHDKAYNQLQVELGRKPNDSEIAEKMKVTVDEVIKIKKYKVYIFSLDDKNNNHGSEEDIKSENLNIVRESLNRGNLTEEVCINERFSEEIREMLENCKLTKREMEVISLIYGLDEEKTYNTCEAADILDVSKQRVAQVELNGLAKIRTSNLIDDMAIYLDKPDEGKKRLKKMRDQYGANRMNWRRAKIIDE